MKSGLPWFAALPAALILFACDGQLPRSAGGSDDHGNAVSATVLVMDSTGAPVADVEVTVRPATWKSGDPLDTSSKAPDGAVGTTGPNGICRISALRPGDYTIVAGKWGQVGLSKISLRDSQGVSLGIYAPGALAGRMLGAPPDTRVVLAGIDREVFTDSSGSFSVGGLPVASYDVQGGGAAGGVLLSQVSVVPRKVSSMMDVKYDSTRFQTFSPIIELTDDILPPSMSPAGGVFPGMVNVAISPAFLGDQFEISINGGPWYPTKVGVAIGGSECIRLRTRRGGISGAVYSQACFTIN